jgi:hypothetical protein
LRIGRGIEQEIGVPEVRVDKGLKVDRQPFSPMPTTGESEIGRVPGHSQGLERSDNLWLGIVR